MKLLIFNPRPDESEEVLLDYLRAMKFTSSLLVHKDYMNYNWKVPKDASFFKPLTVVTYYDED